MSVLLSGEISSTSQPVSILVFWPCHADFSLQPRGWQVPCHHHHHHHCFCVSCLPGLSSEMGTCSNGARRPSPRSQGAGGKGDKVLPPNHQLCQDLSLPASDGTESEPHSVLESCANSTPLPASGPSTDIEDVENTPLCIQNTWPHEWHLSCKASGWGPL